MSIKVTCDFCFYDHTVSEKNAGKKFKCKGCEEPLVVPRKKRPAADEFEEDDDFLGALDSAASSSRRAPAQARSKPKPKAKKKKSNGLNKDEQSSLNQSVVAGLGTVILLVLAIGFRIAMKTDVLDNLFAGSVNWEEFTLPDETITAQMPGKVKTKVVPIPEAVEYNTYYAESKKFATSLSYARFDTSGMLDFQKALFNVETLKGEFRNEFMQSKPGSKIVSEEMVKLDGIPALRVVADMTSAGLEMRLYMHALLAGDTYYATEFIEQRDRPQDEKREEFMASLVLTPKLHEKYNNFQGKKRGLAQTLPGDQQPGANLVEASNPADPSTPNTSPTALPSLVDMQNMLPDFAKNMVDNFKNPSRAKPPGSPSSTELPEVEWSAEPDAREDIPDWRTSSRFKMDLPNNLNDLHYPDPYGPLVIVGAKDIDVKDLAVFSLEDGKRKGRFTGEPTNSSQVAFSRDAEWMANFNITEKIIEVWNVKKSQRFHSFPHPGGKLHHMVFLDSNHLLTHHGETSTEGTYIVYEIGAEETPQPEAIHNFKAPVHHYFEDMMVSPGGRYVAASPSHKKTVYLIDWKQEKAVGQANIPEKSDLGNTYSYKGMNFSPDGESFITLMSAQDDTAVFGWSMTDGSLAWEHHRKGQLNEAIPNVSDDNQNDLGYALEFLPDSSAYAILGRILIDVETGKTLWYLDSKPDDRFGNLHNNRTYHLTPQGMLSIETDSYRRQLQLKPFDPAELKSLLTGMEQDDSARLRPGQQVKLEILIDKLHEGDETETLATLTDAWTDHLESRDYEVVDEASIVLHFDYRELPGEELSFRPKSGTFPSTKMQYRIQWIEPGASKSFWEVENEYSRSSIILRGEPSIKTIRDEIFDDFVEEFTQGPIVYYISGGDKPQILPAYDTTKY